MFNIFTSDKEKHECPQANPLEKNPYQYLSKSKYIVKKHTKNPMWRLCVGKSLQI